MVGVTRDLDRERLRREGGGGFTFHINGHITSLLIYCFPGWFSFGSALVFAAFLKKRVSNVFLDLGYSTVIFNAFACTQRLRTASKTHDTQFVFFLLALTIVKKKQAAKPSLLILCNFQI